MQCENGYSNINTNSNKTNKQTKVTKSVKYNWINGKIIWCDIVGIDRLILWIEIYCETQWTKTSFCAHKTKLKVN